VIFLHFPLAVFNPQILIVLFIRIQEPVEIHPFKQSQPGKYAMKSFPGICLEVPQGIIEIKEKVFIRFQNF
jgi:hypothetical protein